MMTAEQLRGSLLQMAVEGQLVNQIEQEGTGKDLFDLIQKKKKQVINEKKTKKVKFNSMIPDDEKVFDIPTYWEWCRLGSLALVITKGTTPRGGNVAYLEDGIGFLRAENIAGLDKLDLSNLKYVDDETNQGLLGRSIIEANDILITIAGTLGRTGLVREEDLPLNANQAVSIVRFATPDDLDLKYLIYVLNAPAVKRALSVQKKITAIPNLTLEIIANCVIPLPPLAEQKRIVAKIEELMPFVEQYAAASTKLNTLNATFPDMMKKSILQEAVQGKLVPQDPNDEPASVLLKIIAEEKKRLIKEGKIKKQKLLPEITEDEIPFDIPESWKWVRLAEVSTIITGGTPSRLHSEYYGGRYPFYKPNDIQNEKYMLKAGENLSEEGMKKARYIPKGSIAVNCIGSIGKSAIIPLDGTTNQQINSICYYPYSDYIYWMCQADIFLSQIKNKASMTTIPIVNKSKMEDIIIPIPPIQEQRRIVKKIEELMPPIKELDQ